jgi:hypothetical protein
LAEEARSDVRTTRTRLDCAAGEPSRENRSSPCAVFEILSLCNVYQIGAFLPGGGQHVAAWRHADAPADGATSFEFHKQLALTAERGLPHPRDRSESRFVRHRQVLLHEFGLH